MPRHCLSLLKQRSTTLRPVGQFELTQSELMEVRRDAQVDHGAETSDLLHRGREALLGGGQVPTAPDTVLAELQATAGDRVHILTESVGTWVGYFEADYTRVLCARLRELPGLEPWLALGQHRRSLPHHRTPVPPPGHGGVPSMVTNL